MLPRLSHLCVLALLAGYAFADKPADLPNNPKITVQQYAPSGDRSYNFSSFLLINSPMPAKVQESNHDWTFSIGPMLGQATVSVGERTVMDNLNALEQAADWLAQAKKLSREGRYTEALVALDKIRALVPGSSYIQLADEAAAEMNTDVADGTFKKMFDQAIHDLGFNEMPKWITEGKSDTCCNKSVCVTPNLVTLSCTNMPLGQVLDKLRQQTSVSVAVIAQGNICFKQPVSIHVEKMPLRMVLDLLARPLGLEPVVQGEVICLTNTKPTTPRSEECCEENPSPNMCGGSACPRCETLHATFMARQKQTVNKAGIEEQVTGLMKACYLAIEEGRTDKAKELAREAHALDALRVEGDPLVYKFQLLAEKPKVKGGEETSSPPTQKPSNNYPQKPEK